MPFTAPALRTIKGKSDFSLVPAQWVYKVAAKEKGKLLTSSSTIKYSISYTPQWYYVLRAVNIREQYPNYRVDLKSAKNLKKDKIPINTIKVGRLMTPPIARLPSM